MGAKLTVIENRCNDDIEIKVWVYPDPPYRFHSTIRIEANGGWKEVNSKNFIHRDTTILNDEDESVSTTLLMVYIDGVYTGSNFLLTDLAKYAKVICNRNEEGIFVAEGIKPTFNFCRFK
uniref:Uncharacterized protein n=1 Tax=Solanum tuberosum TaxID=4113 RepID=M1DDU2_SOLTU